MSNAAAAANSNNVDFVSSCLENLEKHLDVLNEQKSVTLDAVEKTLLEGDSLLAYLREVGKQQQHQQQQQPSSDETGSQQQQDAPAQKSSSYVHLESILQSVRTRYSDVDKLLGNVRVKLEQHVQFKQFEKV